MRPRDEIDESVEYPDVFSLSEGNLCISSRFRAHDGERPTNVVAEKAEFGRD